MAWVQSLWSDPAVAEEPPADAPHEPPTVPPDVAGGTGGSSGAVVAMGSTGPGTGGTRASSDGRGSSGGSTTIPMSFARPMTGSSDGTGSGSGSDDSGGTTGSSDGSDTGGTTEDSTEGGTTGGGALGGTTGGATAPPSGPLPACLEGEWVIDDLSTYYRRVIRGQAHGRAVRSLGTSGRYTLRFRGADLHGEAKRLRMRYSARLADQDIDYSVVVNGTFDTTVKLEGSDTLVVRPVAGAKIRARETARFPGGKTKNRYPKLPVFGRFEFTCSSKDLELRPIEKGRTKDTIRFVRPSP